MNIKPETLQQLKINNPDAIFENKRKYLTIKNLWNDPTFQLVIDKTNEPVDKLNDTVYFEELLAIYHKKEDKLEFIFTPIEPKSSILKRKFDFIFEGHTYKCFFEESSISLGIIARSFQPLKAAEKSNHRNLREFNDYYLFSKQPAYFRDYYKDKKPYSFCIKGKLKSLNNNFSPLIKTLNFYFTYYDRNSPLIVLLQKETLKVEFNEACYSLFDKFPEIINSTKIDFTILDILHTAHRTDDIRLQFIFYYQILEYCSYYFLENNIRQKLFNILKKPDINLNANDYSKSIIEELQDHLGKHRDDTKKMEKTINSFCCINDIKLELEQNIDFFCKDLEFEGGLHIPKLFGNVEGLKTTTDNTLMTIKTNIEKIRNVLVHLRESRENKVILPTSDNEKKLIPYLYILRRIAEKVSIMYE